MPTWAWIVIGAVALLVGAGILIHNRLVALRTRVDNGWSQIDVQLRRRYDLIPNLVETVKGYATHERELFEKVTQARARAIDAKAMPDQASAENMITAGLRQLLAVAEAYPELQADENFRQLQGQLEETENRVAVSRQVYNDTVLSFNNALQTFPGVVLAGPFGFTAREFYEVTEETQREAPVVDL